MLNTILTDLLAPYKGGAREEHPNGRNSWRKAKTDMRRMRAGGTPKRKESVETNVTLPNYLLGRS
jgi:hypothetical protein